MKITRIINNNVVCAVNERRQEMMLLGSGIGFQKKKETMWTQRRLRKNFS